MNPARSRTAAVAAVVLATTGGLLSAAPSSASAATSCNSPVYTRQFFANTSFSGKPKKTDCDSKIDQNWGTRAPASGLPSNNFGVRWTVTRDFGSGGPFALPVESRDGIRVYLDGVRKVDLWKNVSTTQKKTVNITVPSGTHTLRVDFVNWTGSANVKFAYTPRTSATVDKVKPLVPTGAKATYDTASGKARLSWTKNKEMDLAGYRVYRRAEGASFGTEPLATTTSTSYTDATLPATGETYHYEARAYDKAGNESAGTADQSVTTADRTAPDAPTMMSAVTETGGLRIWWHPEGGVQPSYRVYRAASEGGPFTRIGSPDPGRLHYLDASAVVDVKHFYRVTAVDAAGNESAPSVVFSGTRRDYTPPPNVTGLAATPTEYGFALNWDGNPAADLAKYGVFKGEPMKGNESFCIARLVEYVPAGTTSYEHSTLPDGERVCFVVRAYDTHGNWATSGDKSVIATELGAAPGTPAG
ncbi:PA14 domain-containing protein [Streptomyces sp. Qhu-G9]|uniref:PA14 domain-containing protein n=1 Tax=Streptomyces sp. Qhu-G9 TaxID=3452799 RepID=UPI0022AC6F5A|nr:PA14 domain-containing protein [Streptomyces aurantiacus]WAU78802.1 PA14 domain-containing protein [Streptomyces aurantiacus]